VLGLGVVNVNSELGRACDLAAGSLSLSIINLSQNDTSFFFAKQKMTHHLLKTNKALTESNFTRGKSSYIRVARLHWFPSKTDSVRR
jgi:hypothetical protein